jgi:hypothetical protein
MSIPWCSYLQRLRSLMENWTACSTLNPQTCYSAQAAQPASSPSNIRIQGFHRTSRHDVQLTLLTLSILLTVLHANTMLFPTVNNLCPVEGNPLCSQNGLTGTNQYGANVNFDLCIDSGASAAFFGNDGVGLAVGNATEVSCSEYTGTIIH